MARGAAVAAALAAALLAVSGAGGANAQQTPKRGGTLVSGTTSALEPACLRVFVDGCGQTTTGFSFDMSHVFAGAFEVTPDATFRGNLVSGARIAATDPFTLVYRIRPEARWSDGVPVSAQDFVFTHQALRRYGRIEYGSERIRSVRKIDRKTVRVVLREPDVDWLPAIPLFQFGLTAGYDADVRNYAMHPFTALWNAENWWLAR